MPFSWLASQLQSRPRSADRRQREQTRRRRIALESLEDRTLLSAYAWTGAVDANWSTPGNWNIGASPAAVAPGSSDDVSFTAGAASSTVDASFTVKSVTIASGYSGVISLASGKNLTDLGGFSQAGGTFNVGTSTLTSGKAFTVSGGAFNAGTGTVDFNAPLNYGPGPIYAPGVNFNNVIFDYGANHIYVGKYDASTPPVFNASSLQVNGDLTINGAQQLTGVIYANGDVTTTKAGMFSKSAADKIVIGGTGLVSLTGGPDAAHPGSLPNIQIARSGGNANALTISGFLTANGSWTHTSGVVGATGSTVTLTNSSSSANPIDSNTMSFGNVVIDTGTHFYVKKLNVGGNLTLKNVFSLNYAGGAGSGAITVAGDLSSSDPIVPTAVGTAVDITMDGNVDASIFTGSALNTPGAGAFPSGGIIIGKGSAQSVTANVAQPLDGPLTIKSLKNLNGTFQVGKDVTTSDTSVGGDGVLVFQGTGNQTLTAAISNAQVPGVKIAKPSGMFKVAAPNTISVTGPGGWVYVSGGVDTTNSTVAFSGVGKTVDAGANPFNNVIINMGSADALNVTSMIVGGKLTISSVSAINGTIQAQSNVDTGDASVGGTGKILFNGAGPQILKATADNAQVPSVEIAKTGGSTLTLAGPNTIGVTGNWMYTSGGVDTTNSTVAFNGVTKAVDAGANPFNNVVINMGSADTLNVTSMPISGNLTITSVNAINAASGKITVAGNLTSTDSSVAGTADITLNGSPQNITGGDFPNGGIILNGGSAQQVTASVLQPLDGPLALDNLGSLSGTFQVAGDVSTSVGYYGLAGNLDSSPVLIFMGNKNQTLSIPSTPVPGYHYQIPGVDINKSGGKLTIPSGTVLYVNGSWIVDATNQGTVVATGTTVVFGPYSTPTINTGTGAFPMKFNNVELASGSGSVVTVPVGGVMVVKGDLVITNVGNINAASGVITVAGNLSSSDVSYGGVGGTADITMIGNTNTTLTASPGDFPDGGIIIAKTGGAKVSLGANFDSGDFIWGGKNFVPITVSTGTLDLGTYTLTTRGNLTVASGATLMMGIAASSEFSPQVIIYGDATVAAGSHFVVTQGQAPTTGTAKTYTLIEVAAGYTVTDNGMTYSTPANFNLFVEYGPGSSRLEKVTGPNL